MINDLLLNPPPGIKISLFADDVLLWISSSSLNTCFLNLQLALNTLQNWSNEWGLRFSSTKTKAIIFKKPQLSHSLRFRNHPKILKINNIDIEIVSHHRYLGLTFDSSLTWTQHISKLKNDIQNKINILKITSGTDWGADRYSILLLYKNLVRQKLEYGCTLYSATSTANLSTITVIQNTCLKIATGAFKSTRTEILEVEAGIYPIQYHFFKAMITTAASIIAIENHPLMYVINEYNRFLRTEYKPFSTRAHYAAQQLQVPLDKVETRK